MDIQVGDRVTYQNGESEFILNSSDAYNAMHCATILKIERPKYEVVEVVEEKKELLTEEEKEYLKNIIQPLEYKSLMIRKTLGSFMYIEVVFDPKDGSYDTFDLPFIKNLKNLEFENLEEDKDYTLKELGLEE